MKTERTLQEKTIFTALTFKTSQHRLEETLTRAPFLLTHAEAIKAIEDFKKKYPDYPVLASQTGRLTDRTNVQSPAEVEAAVLGSNYTPMSVNRSAVKGFALEVSRRKKAGKFKRVSPSFIREVEAEVENIIKSIGGKTDPEDDLTDIPAPDFLNRHRVTSKLVEQLNRAVRRLVFRKVKNYPSRGQTLQGGSK